MSISHFLSFSVLLSVFQVIQCLCTIFHIFSVFLPLSWSYIVYFSYLSFFSVSCHIPCPTECDSHFARFSLFLAIFHVSPCEFLCFLMCQFSRHIPVPTECVYHFTRFSVFLTIFQVIQCFCLIFQFFQFSGHNPGHRDCISHTSRFNCFSPYYMSYSVCFSFCTFSVYLPIFHVLPCEFLIFHVF